MYTYAATVVRVIDGDTAILDVDLGFRTWRRGGSFRVAAINARELHAEGGPEARDHLAALLPVGTVVTLTSVRPDKYGERYDALIALPDGSDLGAQLVRTAWAAAWTGRGVAPLPPWPRPSP